MDVKLIPEAQKDYKSLDGSIKKLVNEKIDKLAIYKEVGKRIQDKR
ncbi:MAG: hypothetical protein FWD13_05670 [Treponema sp.]|nr:hypothetical protein [Treponema sp.]